MHTSAEAEREAALAVERAIYGDLFLNLFPTRNNSSVAADSEATSVTSATKTKKGALRIRLLAPIVAGRRNAPNPPVSSCLSDLS
jgi:hypothetical protein